MLKPDSLLGRSNTSRPALKPIPSPPWPSVLRRRYAPFSLQSPREIHLRRDARATATPTGPTSAPPAPDSNIKFKKGFWTLVDVVAILGSVGGALAAILNLFSGTYVLFLPLVLPVVSLLSALQREGLIAEDNRLAYDTLRVSLNRDSNALLGEARSAIEEVRRELRGQNTTAARLGTIEARLSSLEGSILSAGRSAREAAAGLGVLPERLQAEQRSVLEGLVAAMRLELRRAAESLANNETTALARLDARLAAVEGSLSGLEVAQSEGLRRLSMSLNSALADAEATLQSSVRNEVARSMEPVRRLPQMLAVALPPALAAAEAVEASAAGGSAAAAGAAAGAAAPALTPEQMQAIVSQEVEVAVARILDFQAEAFGRLNTVRPVPIDEEQWAALGRRLSRLERLVEGVPAGTEGALLQGGQVPVAVATAVSEVLASQLADARAEVMTAAAREAESVRNDILAAQMVLRDSLDGLAVSLKPLQLGVTELQLAVASVSEAQAQQQVVLQNVIQAMPSAQDADAPATVGSPPPPPATAVELTRLQEGVEAVARLLRDVDTKMDGVIIAMAQLPATAAATAAMTAVPSSPAPLLPPQTQTPSVPDATAAEALAAAARQQQELQAGIDAMKEALAALTTQVGLIATRSLVSSAPAEPPAASAVAASKADVGGVIADVLLFEASLTAAGPPPGGGGVESSSDRVPSTIGATRNEAYDMMLQLAEARRLSGSGATPHGTAAAVCDVSNSGNDVSAPSRSSAVQQLRIVGLPPFEDPTPDAGVTASPATASELSPLPPSQSARVLLQSEQQQLEPPPQSQPLPQQQQESEQQQQMYTVAVSNQLEPQSDPQLAPSVGTMSLASAGYPLSPSMPPTAAAAAFYETATQAVDGLLPQYGGPSSYDEIPSTSAFPPATSAASASFLSSAASPSTSYSSSSESLSSAPLYSSLNGFPQRDSGLSPQDVTSMWEQRAQQQASYNWYEEQQQQRQQKQQQQNPDGGFQSAFREGLSYMAPAAAPTMGGFAMELQAEPPSWYTMQQQMQQQMQQVQPQTQQPRTGQPQSSSQMPPLPIQAQLPTPTQTPVQMAAQQPLSQALPSLPTQPSPPRQTPPPLSQAPPPQPTLTQLPSQTPPPLPQASPPAQTPPLMTPLTQTQTPPPLSQAPLPAQTPPPQQQRQLRFPFWPLPGFQSQPQPQAPPPPPPPRAASHPPPPPQQPPSAAAGPEPRAATTAGGLPQPTAPTQGFGSQLPTSAVPPMGPSPMPTPQQQPGRIATGSATPADYRPRPLEGMNVNEMISEGLRLLRLGREETRKGQDYGLADTLIQGSIAAFTRALEQPSADAKAMGNLGNALLARGELKAAYLEALRSGPPPTSATEATAQLEAERAMTLEANALLTEAGVMFLKVLEIEGWSSRALVNWGRALVIRADLLAATPDGLKPGNPTLPIVAQLYSSAIDKFEGVLEGEPDMVPAKYRCALAMAGLSRTKPAGSRERLTLLADAINYLRDVVASQLPDAEALRSSALSALQQYEMQLMAQRSGRQ